MTLGAAQHVLITGAAGAIGSALAFAFRAHDPGLRFSLVDVDRSGVEREARALGPSAKGYAWDLSVPDALDGELTSLTGGRGPVDILVNCAGIMEVRSLVATDWALADRLLRIDLISPLRLLAHVAPSMQARRCGFVVNVSSMAGVTPLRGCVYYGAAKAGIAMASEIARLELAPHDVHVVTVYPGPVRSGLESRARSQAPDTLLGRLLPIGDPRELAELIVRACVERRARVVYPGAYRPFHRLPRFAGRLTSRLSPTPLD